MFQAFRIMMVTIFSSVTAFFKSVGNGCESLEALSEAGLSESQLIRDRTKLKNTSELNELAEQLAKI